MGSRDRSFSVWTTNLKRPLFVVNDVFDQSVLDLSWSRDGKLLLACSMDGTVAAVILTEAEIGNILSQEKVHELMVSQYGKNIGRAALAKSIMNAKTNGASAGPKIIENPDLLKTVKFDETNGLLNGNAHNGTESSNGYSSVDRSDNTSNRAVKIKLYPKGPTDKQIEAKTSDGRRRITPIYMPPPSLENGEGEENNASINFGNAEFGSSSTQEKSKIAIELKNEIVTPNVSPGKFSNDNSNSLMSQRVNNGNVDSTTEKQTSFLSIVTGNNGTTSATSSTSNSQGKTSTNNTTELSKEKEKITESDPSVKSIQNLVKRKPGPPTKSSENDSTKNGTVTGYSGQNDNTTSLKSGKRSARILSSSEDEDTEPTRQKMRVDTHDDSSSSVKELESNSQSTSKGGFKEYGNSEKLKNLKINKPDLMTCSKRPAVAEEDTTRIKAKRAKTSDLEEKDSSRSLPSSYKLPTVIKVNSLSDDTIRLPPLNAYSSKIFNFQLKPLTIPYSSICNSDGQISKDESIACDGDTKKKASVSITNNLVHLQGNTGVAGKLHQLICQIDDDIHQTWKVFFSSPVTVVTSGDCLIVVACMDGSIHIFNTANVKNKIGLGEKLFPPLQLPSAISKLKLYKNRLAVITCCAKLYVWELGEGPGKIKAIMKQESIEYLLQPGNIFVDTEDEEQEIESVRVTKLSFTEPEGKVIVVTSAGKTFVFNEDLGVWLKLADTYSWVQSASNYSSAIASMPKQKDNSNMPLALLSYSNAPNAPKLQSVSRETQRLASVTHCQEQAVAALNLGSAHEYRFWYLKYIEHLALGGMENISQIRGELSCLLRQSRSLGANTKVLGTIEQQDLLKSSLKIVGGNLELQRVYAEYDEQMKCGWGTSSEDVKDVDGMLLDD